jgi:ribosomal protein S18 acetylase RimI-like enzyme
MSGSIEFCSNKADRQQIVEHLRCCDSAFVPRLSDRVEIIDYAQKLCANAQRFEAWTSGRLIGLVAAYCNDMARRSAYITNVSVLEEWRGFGVASKLTEQCVSHVDGLGFERLVLEVDSGNGDAIRLYENHGFLFDDVEKRIMSRRFNRVAGE